MNKKGNLIYIFDPLCGWCYGFSPVILDLYARKQDEYNFIVLCGGLAVFERALPIEEGYDYIEREMETVSRHSGVVFGEEFRNLVADGNYIYDSLPACRAMIAFRTLYPDKQIEFAHALQESLFLNGEDLNEMDFFVSLADEFGCDPYEFNKLLNSEGNLEKANEEFKTISKMGVTGFPFLFYADSEKTIVLSNGYSSFNAVWNKLNAIQDQPKGE